MITTPKANLFIQSMFSDDDFKNITEKVIELLTPDNLNEVDDLPPQIVTVSNNQNKTDENGRFQVNIIRILGGFGDYALRQESCRQIGKN